MQDKTFIGIDVSQDWIDVADTSEPPQHQRIANTAAALNNWVTGLDPARVALLAFEPTGGLERPLRQALHKAGLPFVPVHPNEVVAFRAARAIKAKTDRIDAALLARFARDELSQRGLAPSVAGDDTLRDLIARRRQLVGLSQAERCRLSRAASEAVRASIQTVLALLTCELDALDAAIANHIACNEAQAFLRQLLCSFKGCGLILAATLLGEVPELGRLSGKEIAALIGLAPMTRQSGKGCQRAVTGHGRPGVRQALFQAARCAIRWNPLIRAFFLRLTEINKRPGKVALTAVMRKILVILNAVARDRKPWAGAALTPA